jgi:hypothetical protein
VKEPKVLSATDVLFGRLRDQISRIIDNDPELKQGVVTIGEHPFEDKRTPRAIES